MIIALLIINTSTIIFIIGRIIITGGNIKIYIFVPMTEPF